MDPNSVLCLRPYLLTNVLQLTEIYNRPAYSPSAQIAWKTPFLPCCSIFACYESVA
jgi:hypothetical protein